MDGRDGWVSEMGPRAVLETARGYGGKRRVDMPPA